MSSTNTRKACPHCGQMMWANNIARHVRSAHSDAAPPSEAEPEESSPFAGEQSPAGTPPPAAEKRRWWQRRAHSEEPRKPKEPRPKKGRERTDDLFRFAWQTGGQALLKIDPPVGRVLMFQAPAIGPLIDDAIKSTMLDRLAQPLARGWNQTTGLGAVLAFPIAIAVVERSPGLLRTARPALREMMRPMLVELAKGAKVAAERQRRSEEAMQELLDVSLADMFPPEFLEGARKAGTDPLDLLLELIFAPAEEGERVAEAAAA